MPYNTLEAADDADFYKKLVVWERENGFRHVAGTITCKEDVGGIRELPEPSFVRGTIAPGNEEDRAAFFAHEHDPSKPLTGLQKRMQSGGA